VPSQSLRANLESWASALPRDAVLVSLMKGVEIGTLKRMSEVLGEVAGAEPERVAVVSGPNLAKEIAARQPAASVVACADEAVGEKLQQACSTPYFRPYTNTDVVGVELGGAVKNVIALAVGMADGMGMGDNSKASIMTRGLAETARLGAALGADPATFAGLAGMGDLVLTCTGDLSRNRALGIAVGRGASLASVLAATASVVEGVPTTRAALALAARLGVDLPIAAKVEEVLHGGRAPLDAVEDLLARPLRDEEDG
jgi:glycerol-3-phosphate dehydrogenase (NAD(P)+)